VPATIDARLARLGIELPGVGKPVANFVPGASDLLVEVFGEAVGRHARFAVGAGSLPFNVAVELAGVLEVAEGSPDAEREFNP
jgi:hypothetical protein